MISARGKRERRLKLGRLINSTQRDLKRQGVHLSRRVIERRLLDRERQRFATSLEVETEGDLEVKIVDRSTIFEENYQKKI